MPLTAWAAGWFLLAALPIAFIVSYSDLSRMKIPNATVLALVAAYAVLGLIALPVELYLWHWLHLPVVLVVGMVLNAAGAMGAGDAKFMAAAAPMIATSDAVMVALILSAAFLAGYAAHRIARATPIRQAVPHWVSWDTTSKRFPMGFPLSMALVAYLGIVLFLR